MSFISFSRLRNPFSSRPPVENYQLLFSTPPNVHIVAGSLGSFSTISAANRAAALAASKSADELCKAVHAAHKGNPSSSGVAIFRELPGVEIGYKIWYDIGGMAHFESTLPWSDPRYQMIWVGHKDDHEKRNQNIEQWHWDNCDEDDYLDLDAEHDKVSVDPLDTSQLTPGELEITRDISIQDAQTSWKGEEGRERVKNRIELLQAMTERNGDPEWQPISIRSSDASWVMFDGV
ncbi:hypothetical protein FPQ18DRAFT_309325 [Pyronema domesticum]|uniref:Uncharacterized protein n=1 Tax=Pyronema omphalodes (strain CBS 100304) TaxID=1076935 RepID=U4L622_PYROM|nr:hypothetical protein FPQ18DRAFT_309325 [Pyronema domesticum]CCX12669.1 Protein of unknown function [Pyronema omphalodes CBS 100304]